jgi:hypothetical protein
MEKRKKNVKNEQPWTLTYILVLQTMSSLLTFFKKIQTNWFSLQNDAM